MTDFFEKSLHALTVSAVRGLDAVASRGPISFAFREAVWEPNCAMPARFVMREGDQDTDWFIVPDTTMSWRVYQFMGPESSTLPRGSFACLPVGLPYYNVDEAVSAALVGWMQGVLKEVERGQSSRRTYTAQGAMAFNTRPQPE